MINLSPVKRFALVCTSVLLLAMGCNTPTPTEREVDVVGVNYLNDSAIQNAIIAQHTLYPYHFVANAPSTNELGEHDLNVLIEHFKTHPGTLNVRRGDTSADLYQTRVNFVAERMYRSHVALGPIEDGPPGGPGAPSERVLTVLKRSYALQEGSGGAQAMIPSGARSAAVNRDKEGN